MFSYGPSSALLEKIPIDHVNLKKEDEWKLQRMCMCRLWQMSGVQHLTGEEEKNKES